MKIFQLANPEEVSKILATTGATLAGIKMMQAKAIGLTVDLGEVSCSLGNIIKQEVLSVGADAAVHEQTSRCAVEKTKVVLVGTLKQLKILAKNLQKNVAGLSKIGEELEVELEKKFRLND